MLNLYSIKPKEYCYDEYIEIIVSARNKEKALNEVDGYFEPWQYPLRVKFIDKLKHNNSGIVTTKYLEHQ